ncbi:hypothetical protein MTsPCn9_24420 [Croceitalea sp. MTPC9]|uniref:sulfite exporter TauE/SafE family protein n=1 Tax=unclassified Croceitalea TaxID=2632280 RepID=UPI002B3B1942|nr:hypothetical protein MTsPCn6_19120 [Croceitalea sp. MTPC6]GMN17504.1 hypothetical protein MTsPCn9_24420 [Croceitalea sp. MTPC9]
MCELYTYILLGLMVGYIGGYAGIGGGPFLVSFLFLFCGMSQLAAQGNVLTMMLGPMSLLGVISLHRYVKTMWIQITVGVIAYCVFSYLGAELAFFIGETNMRIYFAIILFVIAAIQLWPFLTKKEKRTKNLKETISIPWVFVLGSITGVAGGWFGIGAGVLMVPVLITIFKLKKEYARALSLAILVPPVSYGAYIKYNIELDIDWNLVLILFFSYFIANYFGAKAGTKSSNTFFKIIYSIILLSIGLVYLI